MYKLYMLWGDVATTRYPIKSKTWGSRKFQLPKVFFLKKGHEKRYMFMCGCAIKAMLQ